MNDDPRKKNEYRTEHHFHFNRYFVLDQEKRIYIPESPETKTKTEKQESTVNVNSHLPIEIRRDRISVYFALLATVISLYTFYVVARYTDFSGKQLVVSNRSTKAIQDTLAQTKLQNAIQNVQWASINGVVEREGYFAIYKMPSGKIEIQLLVESMAPPRYAKAISVAGNAEFRDEAPQGITVTPPRERIWNIEAYEKKGVGPFHIAVSSDGDVLQEYNVRKKNLYVWGKIFYNDKTREVSHDFCKYVSAGKLPNLSDSSGVPFPPPNGRPEDCPAPWQPTD